jgi:hypothetical protein
VHSEELVYQIDSFGIPQQQQKSLFQYRHQSVMMMEDVALMLDSEESFEEAMGEEEVAA